MWPLILRQNPMQISLWTCVKWCVEVEFCSTFLRNTPTNFHAPLMLRHYRQLWRSSNHMWKSLDFVWPQLLTFNLNCRSRWMDDPWMSTNFHKKLMRYEFHHRQYGLTRRNSFISSAIYTRLRKFMMQPWTSIHGKHSHRDLQSAQWFS